LSKANFDATLIVSLRIRARKADTSYSSVNLFGEDLPEPVDVIGEDVSKSAVIIYAGISEHFELTLSSFSSKDVSIIT
jgi:hypothetical protein